MATNRWDEIEKAYLTTRKSYATLADEFGVSVSSLSKYARRNGWTKMRLDLETKTKNKMLTKIANKKARTDVKIEEVANKLLVKVATAIDDLKSIDGYTARQYAGAIKDIRDIKGIKSDIDIREQEARIAKLIKETESQAQTDTTITVVMEGRASDYSR